MREIVETKDAPSPIGPYAQAIRANGLIFISGQIPLRPETGLMVEGGIESQTHQVMRNLSAILAAAGCGFDKVLKTTVFLVNLEDFSAFNRIYGEYVGEAKPARVTVQVARLPKEALLEVEAIALA